MPNVDWKIEAIDRHRHVLRADGEADRDRGRYRGAHRTHLGAGPGRGGERADQEPVTGAPHRVRVTLPEGFEYHEAEYASSTVRTGDAPIPLQWDQSHAHLGRITWTPQGVVHA